MPSPASAGVSHASAAMFQTNQKNSAAEHRSAWRTTCICTGLALLLAAVFVLNVATGEPMVQRIITPAVVVQVLLYHLPGHLAPAPAIHWADNIVWQIRVPRAVGALLTGGLLALVGAAFQSLLMNPLADPYTVGVSSGAGLGSVVVIMAGGAGALEGMAQPMAAFVCGLLTVMLVYALARASGRTSPHTFLLSGMVVGAFFWSLIPLIITLGMGAGENRQAHIMAALFGSIAGVGWRRVGVLTACSVPGVWALWKKAGEMDMMALGEETALHLGVDAQRFRRTVLLAGSLLTAAAVAVAGIIAFVGFVAPHAARKLVGPQHRGLLPASLLIGALLLSLADWTARVWLHDVQVGVVTSLFGIPLYIGLMRREMRGLERAQ